MSKSHIKYISSLLIFGTNGVVASFIPLGSAQIVWSRTIFGSLMLALIFVITRTKPSFLVMRSQYKRLLISGVSMGLSWVFLFEAYRRAGVGIGTLAYYCGPVIVMALSPLIFRERLTITKLIGIAAVIAGMICVNFADVRSGGVSLGLIYGLASAALYAVMIISNKKAEGLSGLELTLVQLVVACVVVAPYALFTRSVGVSLGVTGAAAIIFLGVVNSGLACYLYFSSLHELPAQTVAICSYIDPASALIFSAVLLGERMTSVQFLGAALILGGAAFGELYGRRDKSLEKTENALS
jgi:drug/metabolite transporter (DMT)-like permease